MECNGETIAEVTDGAVDGRRPSDWWAWHDHDQSRWSATEEEAEDRCAAWTRGESEDGPEHLETRPHEASNLMLERWDAENTGAAQ